ncbi:MAG: PTS sugar transporter subunit IIA [Pirellulales bacterium]
MSSEDFNIDELAAYLHMMPEQVSRLAERGKLPARRVGGQWKFSGPEIHHWLEDRMGLSDEVELARMAGALERAQTNEPLELTELLPLDAINLQLTARTRGSVVDQMAELGVGTGLLWDASKMADAVRDRESMHPTALDNGVALLHPRRPLASILAQAVLALGIAPSGIPFGGRRLTDVFFLICSTNDHEHLRILARLSRVINDDTFLASLRSAASPQEVHELIIGREQHIDST